MVYKGYDVKNKETVFQAVKFAWLGYKAYRGDTEAALTILGWAKENFPISLPSLEGAERHTVESKKETEVASSGK